MAGDYFPVNPMMEIQVSLNQMDYEGQDVVVGDTLAFNVTLYAEYGVNYYLVDLKIGDGEYTSLQHNTPEILGIRNGAYSASDGWDIVIDESMRGKSIAFYFELGDLYGQVANETLVFSVGS